MYVGWHANNIFAPIWLLPISHSHMHVFLIVAYLLILISLIQLGWGCLAEVQVGMYFPFFRQTKVAQSSFFSCVLRGTWFGQKLEKQNLSGVIFFVAFYEHFYSEKGLNNCSIMKSFKKLSNWFQNSEIRFQKWWKSFSKRQNSLFPHFRICKDLNRILHKKSLKGHPKMTNLSTYLYASLLSGLFIHLSPNLFD